MDSRPLVHFSDPHFALEPISTMVVNQPRDEVYLWSSLLISALTLVVNMAAVAVIGRKEKTGVNHLIVLDCFANVLTALVQLFNFMALTNSSSFQAIVCIFDVAMLTIFGTWNRLVPVVLALYRYLLVSFHMRCFLNWKNRTLKDSTNICLKVCHPIFVQNQGGEKFIWPKVFQTLRNIFQQLYA